MTLATHVIVWFTLVGLIAYDVCAFVFRWTTISDTLRQINQQTGWLLAFLMLAVWFHLFLFDLIRAARN